MKLHYYSETDSLYIELGDGTAAETREVIAGVNVDIGENGAVVGIDMKALRANWILRRLKPKACRSGASKPPECVNNRCLDTCFER